LLVIILQIILFQQNASAQDTLSFFRTERKQFVAEPMKATMLAVVLPGMGQIYNRKYWKIPLVYAGFGGMVYAIGFNSSSYVRYMKAFQDFTDDIPATNSYMKLRGLSGLDPATYDRYKNPSSWNYYRDQMLRLVDYYKRYRDLSYIGVAAWYLISILDANVDASLFNYDVSNNLDFTFVPIQTPLPGGYTGAGLGVSLTVNF
jgi:hypothetical protein